MLIKSKNELENVFNVVYNFNEVSFYIQRQTLNTAATLFKHLLIKTNNEHQDKLFINYFISALHEVNL